MIKDFSLVQLMLENKCEAELDIKLQRFLPDRLSNDENSCALNYYGNLETRLHMEIS